jgi:hypothetical protein
MDIKFSYKPRDFPTLANHTFLQELSESIKVGVRESINGLTKGADVETEIVNGKIVVRIINATPAKLNPELDETPYFFNETSPDSFLNVVSEEDFKKTVIEGAKRSAHDVLRVFLQTEKAYTNR